MRGDVTSQPSLEALTSVAETRYGEFRFFTHDEPIGMSLRRYGEWAEREIDLLRSFLRAGDVVLDIGANIGTHTVPFSLAVGPRGKVIAFEAQPEVCQLLQQNVVRNAGGNTTVLAAIAGKEVGTAAVPRLDYGAHFNFGSVSTILEPETDSADLVPVPCRSVDSLALDRCDFMKIDVEGAELDVLKGAEATLQRHEPVLFLECNFIGKGLGVIQFLAKRGYRCFYCSTAAYNPANFRNAVENVFGYAHESSLLFLHAHDAARLSTAQSLGLRLIESKADLIAAFTETLRFGDEPGRHTQAYAELLARQPKMAARPGHLANPVAVIVPADSAPDQLPDLLRSLEAAYPDPLPGLSFYFTGHGYRQADGCGLPFLSRGDVHFLVPAEPLGWVRNVNAAIAAAPTDHDVVILDPAAEVGDDVCTILQADAYADASVATVMPLSDTGALTGLFGKSAGTGWRGVLTPTALSRAMRQSRLDMIPVAHPDEGACLYVKRAALMGVGPLSETTASRREALSDWSERARREGWTHALSCKAMVLDAPKTEPTNEQACAALRFPRLMIVLAALRHQNSQPIYLMTLHGDPDGPTAGGTEKHVRSLQRKLGARGHGVLELFPVDGQFCVRLHGGEQLLVEERLHPKLVPHLISQLDPYVDCLHVHHTWHWPQEALKALASANFNHKLYTAHDFLLVCPSLNMLRRPGDSTFCEVEQDMRACNACLKHHTDSDFMGMPMYRHVSLGYLESFDTLLFPSEALRAYFAKAFGPDWARLSDRAKVLPHDLDYLWALPMSQAAPRPRHIVFLGAMSPHKGLSVIREALPELRNRGFSMELLGTLPTQFPDALEGVTVTPYHSAEELQRLLEERKPQIVAMPSVTAETYSFTFYETLILSETAVPVVGPFGNPASVCSREGVGVVMKNGSSEALIEACEQAAAQWQAFHERKVDYRQTLHRQAESYYEAYRGIENDIIRIVPSGSAPAAARSASLRLLSHLDAELEAHEQAERELRAHYEAMRATKAVRLALQLQSIMQAHPRLTRVLVGPLKLGWKLVKKLRSPG